MEDPADGPMHRRRQLLWPCFIIGIVLLTAGVILGCSYLSASEPPKAPGGAPLEHHPFTGEVRPAAELVGRPILVSIDNFHDARPQSGVAAADIIYEVPMEQGITRLAVLFSQGMPDPVGPIRSVRPYMIALARDLNAVLFHAGGSPQALEILDQLDHPTVNLLEVPLGHRESQRVLPYNLYSSVETFREYTAEQGWEWSFIPGPYLTFLQRDVSEEDQQRAAGPAAEIDVRYGRAIWHKTDENHYLRHTWGEVHEDREAGPITRRNVVILTVPIANIPGDPAGRIILDVTGGGQAWVARDGAYWQGRWHLSGKGLEIVDEDGLALPLAQGTTWVHWTPAGTPIRIDGEDMVP